MRLASASLIALFALSSAPSFAAVTIHCKVSFEPDGEVFERSASEDSQGCTHVEISPPAISKKFWGGSCGNVVTMEFQKFTNPGRQDAMARGEKGAVLVADGYGSAFCEIRR